MQKMLNRYLWGSEMIFLFILCFIVAIIIWLIDKSENEIIEKRRLKNIDFVNRLNKQIEAFEEMREADAKRCFGYAPRKETK